MAHFAEIKDGIVLRVTVVHDNEEANGAQLCHDLLGGEWIQTSYNGKIRKQFAYTGYTYNKDNDVFVAPQPFPSWTLDKNFDWQPPTPNPMNGTNGFWVWNEESISWIKAFDVAT